MFSMKQPYVLLKIYWKTGVFLMTNAVIVQKNRSDNSAGHD